MRLQRFAALAIIMLISACAVEVPPPLNAEQRASYRVEKVVVEVTETASIRWGRGEDRILGTAGLANAEIDEKTRYLKTREGQVALRAAAQNILQSAVEGRVRPALTGTKPMQVSVIVDLALTSSPGLVFLVGGNQLAGGGVQLFDLETGEELSRAQRMIGLEPGGGGLAGAIIEAASRDPMIRLGERFGEQVTRWIRSTEPELYGTDEDYDRQPLPPMPRPEVKAVNEAPSG